MSSYQGNNDLSCESLCGYSENAAIMANKATQTFNICSQTSNNLDEQPIPTSYNAKLNQIREELTNTVTEYKQKNKLCILSNKKTRGSLSAIEDIFSDYFEYCHYLMPNNTTRELLLTIEQKLKDYTLNDYCLLFIGERDIKEETNYLNLISTMKESLTRITHTNIVICAATYIIGAPMYNFRVEMFNNLLYLNLQNNNYAYFFDTNQDLLYEMFSYTSGKISRYGMRNIYKRIMNNILNDLNIFNHINTCQNRSMTLDKHSSPSFSINHNETTSFFRQQ